MATSLERKGFVHTLDGKPKTFEALDLNSALTGYFAKAEESIMKSAGMPMERVLTLLQTLTPPGKVSLAALEDGELSSMWAVEGARDVKFAMTRVIDVAAKEILWVTPKVTSLLLEPNGGHAQSRAIQRGVRQRGIIAQSYEEVMKSSQELFGEAARETFIRALGHPIFEVRHLESLHGRFLISDRRCVVIGSPDRMNVEAFVWSKALCQLLSNHFEELWAKAKPFLPAEGNAEASSADSRRYERQAYRTSSPSLRQAPPPSR